MVVLAIIVSITGVVFTSQSTFNKTLVLANTAYDVALTLRSAETYGLGSRVAAGGRNVGHGIHFEIGSLANQFILFADTYPSIGGVGLCHTPPASDPLGPDAQPGNCVYNAAQGESIKEYTFGNRVTITALYANGIAVNSLDVVFARPNPDPSMSANGTYSSLYTTACIELSSPQGGTRFVGVAASGEITANAASCI